MDGTRFEEDTDVVEFYTWQYSIGYVQQHGLKYGIQCVCKTLSIKVIAHSLSKTSILSKQSFSSLQKIKIKINRKKKPNQEAI